MLRKRFEKSVEESVRAVQQLALPESLHFMEKAAGLMADCFRKGGKLLIAGNGGSMCDAMHFAEELTGFFRDRRPALPALALSDPGHLSCVGNDMGFHHVFSRGIEAFGQPQDLFIGLTTSGNSPNMIEAFRMAENKGLKTIAFLGKGGGALKGVADLELIIEGFVTSDRIQEAHMAAIHMIIEATEVLLFANETAIATYVINEELEVR